MNATTGNTPKDCFRSIICAPAHHKKLLIVVVLLLLFYTTTGKNVKNKDFDYFVFSQRWLPTSCIDYVEHGSSNSHWCALPNNFEFWAVHGLWPTQNNHMGPFFCNNSMIFDEKKLQPIESDLRTYWPNIEGGQTVSSLWQHEWEKHGTCAAQLESLNSELKYFNVTLGFFKTHNMNNIFNSNSIRPDPADGIRVDDLFQIIKNTLGKLPQIDCIHEVKTNQPYLAEIRLCFNKNLELIDCGHMNGNKFKKGLTNCPLDKKIIYPDNIHPKLSDGLLDSSTLNRDYYNSLLDMLHILRFLMWASI